MLNTLSYFVQAISAQCVSFFQNFHLVKRVSAFIADLGLRSNFLAKEKVGTFRHHETFRKKPNFSEQLIFLCFRLQKNVVCESYSDTLGYFWH